MAKTEHRVKMASGVSANELLGTTLPERKESAGLGLGEATIHFYAIESASGKEHVSVIERPLGGRELNQLLYEIAPYKNEHFGLDTNDILGDWQTMAEASNRFESLQPCEYNRKLVEDHRKMGAAWKLFMQHMPVFRQLISRYRGGNADGNGELFPLIRWNTEIEGRTWVPDSLSLTEQKNGGGAYREIIERRAPYTGGIQPERLNPLAGLFALAYFSPEITSRTKSNLWPERANYSGEYDANGRLMGPTQVPVLAIMKADELMRSRFLKAAEEYVSRTGRYI